MTFCAFLCKPHHPTACTFRIIECLISLFLLDHSVYYVDAKSILQLPEDFIHIQMHLFNYYSEKKIIYYSSSKKYIFLILSN